MFIGATIFAQQPNQPNQIPQQAKTGQQAGQPQGQQAGQTVARTSNDAIAACLAIENQEEVQIAEFAASKTKNKEVKEFASMLVQEHNGILGALRQVAPNTAQLHSLNSSPSADKIPANETTTQQNRNQASPVTTASGQSQAGAHGSGFDIVQLHLELAEQCLIDSKEKLSQKKSDGEFDRCFIGMQLAKHEGMKTKLTVLQRHATGELKNVIADGLEKTKKHLQTAENLWQQLDDDDSSSSTEKRKAE